MKFSAPRSALLAALAHCAAVVSGKATHFAASCVQLIASAAGLTLQATDAVSTSIRVRVVGAATEAEGAVAVSAKDLLERVKAMPDGSTVDLELKADLLVVRAGKKDRRFTLRTVTGGFPSWPQRGGDPCELELPGATLAEALGTVTHAICDDASRIDVHGAFVTVAEGRLGVEAASDGRLAVCDTTLAASSAAMKALLGPRSIALIARVAGSVASVRLDVRGAQLFVDADAIELALGLVNATFPPARMVLGRVQEGTKTSAEVDRKAFLEAVRSAGLSATGKGHGVALRIDGAELFLSAKASTGEEAVDSVSVSNTSPEPAGGTYPATQLADALSAAPSDTVVLAMADNKPMTLTSEADGRKAVFVIMNLATEAA